MAITAKLVKELREITGAGMMDCKKALVDADADLEVAADILRTKGQAKAQKAAGRIAAEGAIEIAADSVNKILVLMEINSETDFVAKDENFLAFSRSAANLALASSVKDLDDLMESQLNTGETLNSALVNLISKIGEKIAVRRFVKIAAVGDFGLYRHGNRIGVIVDITGGDEELRKDLAMHIAASSPICISDSDVPAKDLDRERRILTEQASQEGKPEEIVKKMVSGRLKKYLSEITLLGQAFVKDPDISVSKLLDQKGAIVNSFSRFEVGEGIEKREENFAAEVAAQVKSSQ
ncbi:MAG: translation elongation factor Ts [Pseudomonadota bacterium]|nr:translation elongation factor Ts [Pseudomonadota bacterium]